ncbi:hypothetical protein OIDMADRAFT_58853 [Oidiodendron maius Zn]|uniref:Secreted protein n=1 Tax=Oidiodendron maius (strain Zn) TaxID=913774 RepID=A0A0C3GZE4_OIDMZ|nr:hypothetical protein OIDMADRAFT_58853 [Oidiodendron maius Zn]
MYLSASPLKPLAILLAYLLSASYLGVASGAVNHIRELERRPHHFNETHPHHFNGTRTHHFNGSHHHHNESRLHHTNVGVPRPIGGHVRPEPYTVPDAAPSSTPDAATETT